MPPSLPAIRHRQCERADLQGFLKPSDGLEPSTPSLPWRLRVASAQARECRHIALFLQIRRFEPATETCLNPSRADRGNPTPVPKTCPQWVGAHRKVPVAGAEDPGTGYSVHSDAS